MTAPNKSELESWLFEDGEDTQDGNGISPDESRRWLLDVFPEESLRLPRAADQHPTLNFENPYLDGIVKRHPTLRKSSYSQDPEGVNGYIKFRLQAADFDNDTGPASRRFQQPTLGKHHRSPLLAPPDSVPKLPLGFGKGLKLDKMDSKLLTFYTVAFCGGRTLLPKTNFWLNDYAAMAADNECVKHALLSLAASYVLDYIPSEVLLERANRHYTRAVKLLTDALRDPHQQASGHDDSLVCSLVLLTIDDLVNWELRRSKAHKARWQSGAEIAKKILDNSDPGHRYWKNENVQCSSARTANANWVAFVGILAQPVAPLKFEDTDRLYAWLLGGTEMHARKIYGGTGLSPKLLHMFAQITHLCARMDKTPDSRIIPHGAAKVQARLEKLQQWSDLSIGFPSCTALLNACDLDKDGKVESEIRVTELTGETWRVAAQIYLHCRFYRRPRNHPIVKERLNALLGCIKRMPYTGPLFTSQAPFFPVVIMALISTEESERKIAHEWFTTVVAQGNCRSSVPPVWHAVQYMWGWMDSHSLDDGFVEDKPIGQQVGWWEKMVTQLVEQTGVISLV
ncbi:uncharacterized protein ALTATR162_LOCUS3096 [Alternaria atra]|uniref:Uncharacterized protein n=1 Tax=Alternaria atra TaxID=119953 RepID=A0A8J2I5I3_9PLEO|nr:uncharacterized protein ALTATR162_LOCUS3096 [Alternaria atra]CAG5153244.1 unnamed protein product [Alternaria atra]